MKILCITLATGILVAAMSCIAYSHVSDDVSNPSQAASSAAGSNSFDFLVGEWKVHHRYLRLQGDRLEWAEVEGTCSLRKLMDGSANIEEHTINAPSGTYRTIGLRSYDLKTGQWAIWWLDGRYPSGPLDPPVVGGFQNGVGTFYANYDDNGKQMRRRFIWSQITPKSARWEQATSSDDGKTWETNWIMNFERKS